VLKNLESVIEKQTKSISASPLKARSKISSISMVSKIASKNLVGDASKVDNVDFCNQIQPELFSNQSHNILQVCKLYRSSLCLNIYKCINICLFFVLLSLNVFIVIFYC